MICAAVIVCRGHRAPGLSANIVPKRQQWDNFFWALWFKRWDAAWLITLQQILHTELWNYSPPPASISSADYRCCYCLPLQRNRLWGGPTEERMFVKSKQRNGAPHPGVQGVLEVCTRAALCQETPHHFTASPGLTTLCSDPWPWLCFVKQQELAGWSLYLKSQTP